MSYDDHLIHNVRTGNREAFDAVVAKHYAAIYPMCCGTRAMPTKPPTSRRTRSSKRTSVSRICAT